jgi:O-antigen ligase
MGEKSREKRERRDQGIVATGKEDKESMINVILRRIIFIATGLILFTPFVISAKYFFPFVGPKSIYFMALAEIIFAAWLVLIISAPKYRPSPNALLLALIIFLAASILSSIFGVDFSRSFWSKYERMTGILMQLHLFAFFLAASSVFRDKKDWLKIFGVSTFAAVLMGATILLSKININVLGQISEISRGGATIGNSSFLGTYLLFNFFLALYLCLNLKGIFRIFSVFSFLVIGSALFFSTAQAAILSTAAGLVLLLLLYLAFMRKGKLRLLGASLLIFSILLALFSVFVVLKSESPVYKLTFGRFLGQTFGGRFVVWGGAWKSFLDKPLLGWGTENFEIAFTKNYPSCLGTAGCGTDIWYDRAHNVFFDTLVTTGILGLISYFGIFVAAILILWKKFLQKNIGFWTGGVFLAVLVSYFIQNLTVFDMINSYMMFFLVLGFIGSISARRMEIIVRRKSINFPIITAILVLFTFSFYGFVIRPLSADRNIINAISFPPGSQERLDFYEKTFGAGSVGKYQTRDFFLQSDLEFIQGDWTQKVSLESLKRELDFIIAEEEKTVKEVPLDFRAYLKLGQAYNLYTVLTNVSKLQEAEKVLTKAIELSPTNQQGYWGLAQTNIYQGKFTDALSLAEKAVSLEPRSFQANLVAIQVVKIIGDYDLAEQKVKEAIEINPSWETDLRQVLGR